jgi:proline dehydrogenase
MKIPIFNRFILLESQLNKTIINMNKNNIKPIIDYAIEGGNNLNYYYINNKLINTIKNNNNNYFAIKLSVFPTYDLNMTRSYLDKICKMAQQTDSKILIDAEDVKKQNIIDSISDEFIDKYNKENCLIYKTYQTYRKDSIEKLTYDIKNFNNLKFGIKLVRGAYKYQDTESGLLFDNIEDTHKSYDDSTKIIFDNFYNKDVIWATHNIKSIELVKNISYHLNIPNSQIKFAQLLGMKNKLTNINRDEGYVSMKYVPYGPILDTLPYLTRRLYENYTIINHFI